MTIDDRIFAFFCKTMLFFIFGCRSSNTHFEQLLRAFYRIFAQRRETPSLDSIPAASTIFCRVLKALDFFGQIDVKSLRAPGNPPTPLRCR
jgi:hypothetical protein